MGSDVVHLHPTLAAMSTRYGVRFVEAEPVRQHITELREAAGFGLGTIAEYAGVSIGALNLVVYGQPCHGKPPARHVLANTAAAILTLVPDPYAAKDCAVVPAHGVRNRLRALLADGRPTAELAGHLGLHQCRVRVLLGADTCLASTARNVRDAYTALADQPAPAGPVADRARRYAHRRGWTARPIDWDTDQLDRVDGRPFTEPAREHGRHHGAADPDEFDFLVSCGESAHQAAKAVGASLESIERAKQRRAAA